ncbi:hypothetical protein SOV_28210 [Sporomusa ovata DSM 2662]|uniref:Uncharacterized protein n=1 Tax=Sporomusa ovata TaxID=2378 RepID=A0A0U1L1C4_9FIRM|nr:hypothetical protein SOV_7c00050 [Sporomusa ovata DSM 2662]CQR73462.1 hypothetical protein SpAn4DRAFT_5123 [Sporomusa ovata]
MAAGYPVGVDIEEHLRGTVAQTVLGVFDADAVGREAAGVIMPEFMKGDIDAGRFGQALKLFGPVARVLKFAEGVREYQVVVLQGPSANCLTDKVDFAAAAAFF